jgi:hypothetical protein
VTVNISDTFDGEVDGTITTISDSSGLLNAPLVGSDFYITNTTDSVFMYQDPTKSSMLEEFIKLSRQDREEMITSLRVHYNYRKMLRHNMTAWCLQDAILSTVSIEDFENEHAKLVLEEQLK